MIITQQFMYGDDIGDCDMWYGMYTSEGKNEVASIANYYRQLKLNNENPDDLEVCIIIELENQKMILSGE